MSTASIFMAEGMEEVECLTIVDILRRGGVDIQTVSIADKKKVKSSHHVKVCADVLLKDTDCSDSDILILPGGVPGVQNLLACKKLTALLKEQYQQGKRLAAICAAPSVLGQLWLLQGKHITCYPGWEDKCPGAEYTGAGVLTDGNITTGRGMGFSVDFALELLRILEGQETADTVKKSIQHPASI